MPTLDDDIDMEAAREFIDWWRTLPGVQRLEVLKSMRGFAKWLIELYAIVFSPS